MASNPESGRGDGPPAFGAEEHDHHPSDEDLDIDAEVPEEGEANAGDQDVRRSSKVSQQTRFYAPGSTEYREQGSSGTGGLRSSRNVKPQCHDNPSDATDQK